MRYDIAAKETVYRGITFRSRLEATWAAMFDILGWDWAYETDLISPKWLPDFQIRAPGSPGGILPVEVKPSFGPPDIVGLGDWAKVSGATSALDNEALALGLGPFESKEYGYEAAALGWILQWTEGDGNCGSWWTEALMHDLQMGKGRGLITDADTDYPRVSRTDRITGERIRLVFPILGPRIGEVQAMWGAAKKTVRYEPR